MKQFLAICLMLLTVGVSAQQKYQSLLWKISGNELKKDSYLYGTMHVSSKVAFRLDDVFYKALKDCDAVALESDPTTWMEHNYELMGLVSGFSNYYLNKSDNFYERRFQFNFPNDLTIRSAIRFDNYIINGYLYRKSFARDNFEEETYLDMFIFQAGKKQLKPIFGLEDFKESRYLTTKASYNISKKKIDSWLQKEYKNHSRFDFTEEAYRNRNLDLLDSIGSATNTEHFRRYMLYERNHNMVEVLDSLMHTQSVFSGVGAAHLPGENGMIELLRKKGYQVTPLKSKQSDFGKKSKKEIESIFIKPLLREETTNDGFLRIKSFEKLHELNFLNQNYYVATDMTNGAYLAITRINTFNYLNSKSKVGLKDIDNFLFEDIPGEILTKEYFETPHKGIRVLNKTKKGDYQRYAIYKTPLEIVIVKLGGKQDYVLKYGDEIFDSISFKPVENKWQDFIPEFKKYEFAIPSNYIAENLGKAGKRIVQSYDENGFYFFEEVPINDTNYIEEDAFEASYIHKAFLDANDLKPANGMFENDRYSTYISSTIIDSINNKKISLKSVIKDGSYYLMGYAGNDLKNADTFFKSFKIKPMFYDKKVEKVIDTSLHFSVQTMAKQPFPNIFGGYGNKKKKPYDEHTKRTNYSSKTNEAIFVKRTKHHDLQMFANIDSLWSKIKNPLLRDYYVVNEEKSANGNSYSYDFVLRDSLSTKQIRVKNILKKGTLFELKTLEDSISPSSKFVNNFYSSFQPLDTLLGRNLFEDKVPEFFEALKKNDSIVFGSIDLLNFTKTHKKQLKEVISNFDFPEDKMLIKSQLVKELIRLSDPEEMQLVKQLYASSYREPQIQITIIKSLINKKDKSSYKLILDLLETDFPVSSDYNVKSLFSTHFKKDSLKLKRELFPELLKYSSITEYKEPVYTLLSKLLEKNLIKVKDYKKYKNQILNDAKLELKRNLFNSTNKRYNRYSAYRGSKGELLTDYVNILFPFKDEKELRIFFTRLLESNENKALSMYYALLKKNNLPINQKLSEKLLSDIENYSFLIDKLRELKVNHDFLKDNKGKLKYARSKILSKKAFNEETDEITFLKEELIKVKEEDIAVYFFKLKEKNNYTTNNSVHAIAFSIKNGKMILKPFYESKRNGQQLDDISEEEKVIEEILDTIKHLDRKRLFRSTYSPF